MREEEEEPFAPSLGDDPLDLRGYVRVLGRNKSKILAAGVLGAILFGVGGLFLLEDTYTVSARDYAYDYSYEDESDDHPSGWRRMVRRLPSRRRPEPALLYEPLPPLPPLPAPDADLDPEPEGTNDLPPPDRH